MHGTGTCGSLIYLAVSLCAHTPVAAQALPHVSVVIGNLLPSEGGTADVQPSVLNSPFGIDFDRRGNMLIVELEGGHALRVVTPNGRIRTVAGTGERGDRDGPARQAQLMTISSTSTSLSRSPMSVPPPQSSDESPTRRLSFLPWLCVP